MAFKCTHYSVTENAGTVEITVLKRQAQDIQFGIRTVEHDQPELTGTEFIGAKAERDFEPINKVISMGQDETEK